MSLTSERLRDYKRKVDEEYVNLEPKQVVDKFMESFKVYLRNELEENHCESDPPKLLISLAKIGYPYATIYQGQIPLGYEDLLIPHLKIYLQKVFKLDSFLGFGLQFRGYRQIFQSIRLSWDENRRSTKTKDQETPEVSLPTLPAKRKKKLKSSQIIKEI